MPPDLVYESWQIKKGADTLIVDKQKAKLVKWFWEKKHLERGGLKGKNMHLCNIQKSFKEVRTEFIKKQRYFVMSLPNQAQ